MKFSMRILAILAVTCVMALCVGCSGGGGGGGSSTTSTGSTVASAGTGTLAVSLTDAPAVDFEAVYVTIDRVEVHLGGNEASPNNWKVVEPPESGVTGYVKRTYNLLELTNGVLEELGMTDLPAGLYTQMRLIIGTVPDEGLNIFDDPHEHANYIILKGTEDQTPLKVPSGTQTGIKLVRNFTVGENQLTELILDFDAANSIVRAGKSGNYHLKPTIKVLGTEVLAYFIEGTVLDDDKGTPLQGVTVTAQVSNSSATDPKDRVFVESTSSTGSNGDFRLLVRPGTYNIVAYMDKYDFDLRCGVDAAADAESGTTTELRLRDIASGVTEYGYVGGNVTGTDDVTISFRAPESPECGARIEVKSVIIGLEQAEPPEMVPYKEILPVSGGSHYDLVASSPGKLTKIESGVTVESGVTTVVNFDLVN